MIDKMFVNSLPLLIVGLHFFRYLCKFTASYRAFVFGSLWQHPIWFQPAAKAGSASRTLLSAAHGQVLVLLLEGSELCGMLPEGTPWWHFVGGTPG